MTTPKVPRKKDGTFQPGYAPASRRKTGTRNKITRDIKEGIVEGAVLHGEDGEGKGGLNGYLKMCARKYPRDYMTLLGKLLPFTITANKSIGVIGTVNIVPAPSDRFLSAESIREMTGLPALIEPQRVVEEEPEPD